ncbi:tail fiber domain-containing protein [Capilliphycus salinus ALCB114379]|uniref:tail fiber domain-containing protein n=1 Tax=Capilliphycus salinus TaxID=2768948 RepID=UPI0039A5F59A
MTSSNGNATTLTAVRPDIFQIFLQDEDGQNILSIDDGALRQSLRIEIVNTSGKSIEFQSVDNQATLENYHFCISFRPGTLLLTEDEDKQITLKEKDKGWQMQQQDSRFYLLLNSADSRVIENGERITLTLENIGAAPGGGSRGTRVEIKYNYLQYQGSNEKISGNRLQYLNIVNQRGKKQIPLYVGFLGSNTILNDGSENELTLTIQSLPNPSASLTFLESPEITETNTTRWEEDIVQFLQEKISNFGAVLKELEQDTSYRDQTRNFFGNLDSLIESNPSEKSLSFKLLKEEVDQFNLQENDKSEIATIIINSLGIVSQDDLNSIATKLGELLSFDNLTQIQEVIQQSTTLQVIKSELNQNGSLGFKGLDSESTFDQAAKFTISFDVAITENDAKHWALVEKTDADNLHLIIEQGQQHWVFGGKEEQGITPRWNFICKQGWSLQKENREEILRLKISNLKTKLLSGYANLYVHYENIPGYWDGYITVPIHKGPLVYREKTSGNNKVGCVGIGTDEPEAKLHVKSSTGVDGLKVQGNTAIAGKLSITNAIQPSVGNSENNGIMFPKDPFGGSGDKAWIRYYRRGSSGENTVFEIGTANDAGDHIALIPNNGNVGIGTNTPTQKLTVSEGHVQIDTNRVMGLNPNDKFTYDGKSMSHYSIGWFSDSWFQWGATSWISGYGGFKFFTNGSPKLTIDYHGNIRYTTSLAKSSSREIKDNIVDLSIKEAFATLNGLNPVKYTLKADEQKQPQLGFIAEAVPDIISSQDRKAINPDNIITVLTCVVKEQQQTILALVEKVNALEELIDKSVFHAKHNE